MSHDGSGHDSCGTKKLIPLLHFENPKAARGVTDPGVGSGALLGLFNIANTDSANSREATGNSAGCESKSIVRRSGSLCIVSRQQSPKTANCPIAVLFTPLVFNAVAGLSWNGERAAARCALDFAQRSR